MNIAKDHYKDIIRAKPKDIRRIKKCEPKVNEVFYILSALLRLTRIRATDWKNIDAAEQIQVELDFVRVLLDFLDFNNRNCRQSLRLGLRELESEEQGDDPGGEGGQ